MGKPGTVSQRHWRMQKPHGGARRVLVTAIWVGLEVDILALVRPSMTAGSANTLAAASWETLRQNHAVKLFLNSWLTGTMYETTHVCRSRSLRLGIIYYLAKGKYYSHWNKETQKYRGSDSLVYFCLRNISKEGGGSRSWSHPEPRVPFSGCLAPSREVFLVQMEEADLPVT